MALTNNFSLTGVAPGVQYGKTGGRVVYNSEAQSFEIKLADNTTYASVVADDIITVDGNIYIQNATSKLFIEQTSLSLQQDGVMKFDGSLAVAIPAGDATTRPTTPEIGMIRVNTSTSPAIVEFYDGTAWSGVGGAQALPNFTAVAPIQVVQDAITGYSFSLQTIPVAYGGTGSVLLPKNQLLFGDDDQPVKTSAGLTFDDTTNKFTVGVSYPVQIDGNLSTVSALAENADLILLPNGGGRVVAGGVGETVLTGGNGEQVTLKGTAANIVISSETGNTVLDLPTGQTSKVTVAGPSASEYATGLGSNDLVNKYYVDSLVLSLNGGSF